MASKATVRAVRINANVARVVIVARYRRRAK